MLRIFAVALAFFLFWYSDARSQACPGFHRATSNGNICLTQSEEDIVRAEWAAWETAQDTALPDVRKAEAEAEARSRILNGFTTKGTTHIGPLRVALTDLLNQIDTMTLADLQALDVTNPIHWP